MAIRNRKRLNRQNDKALKEFFGAVYGAVDEATNEAMHVVAQEGLAQMVKRAEFSDYTGSMINSYQAAIKKGGSNKFAEKLRLNERGNAIQGAYFKSTGNSNLRDGRINRNIHSNHRFKDSNGEVVLYTSYNLLDRSIQSSIKLPPKAAKKIKLRKRRNEKSVEYMNNRGGYKVDGYGRIVTRIKGARSNVRSGYAVIFDNPTPYAGQVHNQNGNKVFPTRHPVSRGFLEQSLQRNLEKSLQFRKAWKNVKGK